MDKLQLEDNAVYELDVIDGDQDGDDYSLGRGSFGTVTAKRWQAVTRSRIILPRN